MILGIFWITRIKMKMGVGEDHENWDSWIKIIMGIK